MFADITLFETDRGGNKTEESKPFTLICNVRFNAAESAVSWTPKISIRRANESSSLTVTTTQTGSYIKGIAQVIHITQVLFKSI